ncbi:MAG: hypothetical protein KF861_18325, partial [Planctomycetaceae bacterium]|nr:hypothetical protein [Planctomycetaceae bacterium]
SGGPELPAWLTEDDSESPSIVLVEGESATPPPQERAELRLTVEPGDRFRLRKVIEQELQQASLSGTPQVSKSTLELVFSITVDDVQADRTRMRVRYEQIRYSHSIDGESTEYDSATPPSVIPEAVLPYHGMINDGFAFDLGPDHRLAGVVGFHEFLERCLQFVPAEQGQRVLLEIESGSGEQGIVNFIDNTLGLLPAEIGQTLGETWEKSQQIGRPIPMYVQTIYTLKGLSHDLADIGITGTITGSTPLGRLANEGQDLKITVQGGRCTGHCLIDRTSGLPKESHIERVVDMTVQLAGGIEFPQQNRTVTTVESLAEAASERSAAVSAASGAGPTTRFQ